MRITGLIVEYNPFHNGHLHHLKEAAKKTNADVTVAIMSGNFLQRGEPAIIDKWTRAKVAVETGVDLVFELPFHYAVQPADRFAAGAVSMLHQAGVTDLVFGSECGDTAAFIHAAKASVTNKDQIDKLLKKQLKTGISFPKAYASAIEDACGEQLRLDMSKPNNSLGFHYTRAAELFKPLQVHTIQRIGANYHDEEFKYSTYASATGIRKAIFNQHNWQEVISDAVPHATLSALDETETTEKVLNHWESFYPFLQYRLMTSKPEELSCIYDCDEGIENRLIRAVTAADFDTFIKKVKTKRYTRTRIQRLLVHMLIHVTKKELQDALEDPPPYRILAMNETGKAYLHSIKHRDLHFISNKHQSGATTASSLNERAAQIYHLPIRHLNYYPEEYKRRPIFTGQDEPRV
ncbi:nucleotidyltransferase [Salisediminibacterium beveridgei]|uniref:tRNA(Met) cytidine acetate ligase n=1 Tax=Salisediminibacterium beveridgei TaxID=632773 RepID=A0A1D7QWE0_9BACI|nr:nucleotidyltransferase [Salisediminibacterium beveridgei]AOM83289.1 hypothetical protein BBEV_1928 [Salisediminibacterium beveridgei]